MQIARQLRNTRLGKSLPLAVVAASAGLRPSSLALLEKGEQVPSWEVLETLAEVLGVPLTKFFFDDHNCVVTPRLTPRRTLQELLWELATPAKSGLAAGAKSRLATISARITGRKPD